MAGRNDRVPRPRAVSGWRFKFRDRNAADGWDDLCSQLESATATAWDHITSEPRSTSRSTRQHRLAGKLGSIDVKGTAREQWQYEVSGAARIWYAIDDDDNTIWLIDASVGHPKRTE